MPKKNQETKPERYVSKRQRSKWERQKRLQRIIGGAGIVVIAIVIAIMGVGLYNSQVKPYTRKVVRVNDVTFNMRYYINMMKIYRAFSQGNFPESMLADYVEQQLEQQELIKQGANALGVTVDRKTVEAELKKAGSAVTRERVDMMEVNDLLKKMQDDYFKPKIAASQPQVNAVAMLVEDEVVAQGVKKALDAGGDFGTTAASLSLEQTTKSKSGALGWNTAHLAELDVNSTAFGDILSKAAVGTITGPVYDATVSKDVGFWVLKVLEKQGDPNKADDPEKAHVSGILVGTAADAQKVKDRLKAGEDFAAVAKDVSQSEGTKENGGDFGWVNRSQESGEIGDAIFKAKVGDVIGPLRDAGSTTKGGYWLVKILEKDDNRQLTDDQMQALVGEQLSKWVEGLPKASGTKVVNYLDAEMKAFALQESANPPKSARVVQ